MELHPEISANYLDVVENPMDLRTIEEERIPEYQSIRELQQDLIQMFDNCVIFNGKRSSLSKYAMYVFLFPSIVVLLCKIPVSSF